jgi:hypothetical protein
MFSYEKPIKAEAGGELANWTGIQLMQRVSASPVDLPFGCLSSNRKCPFTPSHKSLLGDEVTNPRCARGSGAGAAEIVMVKRTGQFARMHCGSSRRRCSPAKMFSSAGVLREVLNGARKSAASLTSAKIDLGS